MDIKTNILKYEKLNSDFVIKRINKVVEFICARSGVWTKGELKQGVTSKATGKKLNI